MKYTFKNLGPIEEGEFEPNDLTILVGPNNSGKSYLMSMVYLVGKFLENNIIENAIQISFLDEATIWQDTINPSLASIIKKNNLTLTGISRRLKKELSLEDNFDFSVNIIEEFNQELNSIEPNQTIEKTSQVKIKNRLAFLIKKYLGMYKWTTFAILTSERQAISLFYKEILQNRFELVNILQESPDNMQELLTNKSGKQTKPTSDNIIFYQNLDDREGNPIGSVYIFELLHKILGGKISKKKHQEIKYTIEDKELSLHLASSSVRAFTDIYLYLSRMPIGPGDKHLLIDEPESHLTLENQRILAKLLVALVNNGIKVMISTHSDFLVKEINNLIMLHSVKDREQFVKDNPFYTIEDHIDHTRVSMYETGKKLIKNNVTKRGIESPFIDKALVDLFEATSALDYQLDLEERDGAE